MPRQASSPLVRSYLKRKRRWSDHGRQVATSILNRWCRFLDDRQLDLLEATGDDCSDFITLRYNRAELDPTEKTHCARVLGPVDGPAPHPHGPGELTRT